MSYAHELLATSPSRVPETDISSLARCVESAFDCAQACTSAADACLGQREPARLTHLARCLRLNLHCADVCLTTGRLLSRQEAPELARAMVEVCALACRLAGEENEQHADEFEYCRITAAACRQCEQNSRAVLAALPR